jgi:hypothetical protein
MELDLEGMERRLSIMREKSIFIEPGMTISKENIVALRLLICEYGKYNFENCIGSFSKNSSQRLTICVETECTECKNIGFVAMGRGKFVDYISSEKYICEACKNKITIRKEEDSKQVNANYEKERESQTSLYVDQYLDPNSKWNKKVPFSEKYKIIFNQYFIRDAIYSHVKTMDYYDYLKTPQWKVISEKKKRQAGYKCELCNATGFIAVHHKTYEHKGIEMDNLKDLVVLCDDCHKKFHEIEE